MKVIISGYVGKKITGIGRNLISLLDNSSTNNRYIVYTNYDMCENLKFTNPNVFVKTYSVSKNSSLKNLLWTTFIFPFIVLKEKGDIALIPNFTLLLVKFRPTFVIMHDLIEFNVPKKFSRLKMFYRIYLADPITAKIANHIITVSKNSKKDIIRFLRIKEEKITVIYNGVDQMKFKKMPDDLAQAVLSKKKWPLDYILYAGTIDHPGKNVIAVIKAFEALKKRRRYNGSLILAGMPGSGYDYIEEYVSSSEYRNDIIFTGYVTDQELVALYSVCKVFCFVSLYEGFGIPPLEALSCGAKVIVSNTSSLPEVVGDVGIVIETTNDDNLPDKIDECIKNTYYIDIVKLHKHLKKYDWKNLSKRFEDTLCNYRAGKS